MARSSPGRGGARRPGADLEPIAALYREVYAVVRRIPRGRVLTYGQVAELAGHPGAARAVGAAMRASSGRGVPWQRVVARQGRERGRVAIVDPVGGAVQRQLLEREGVRFTATGHIALADHGWIPPATATPGRRSRRTAVRGRRR